jgi:hypothetical protein
MQILSHRGCWKSPEEKNSETAFRRSFGLGFGTETDVRDYLQKIVISHDIPTETTLSALQFFEVYKAFNSDFPLALNIKSDGLQTLLRQTLDKYDISNYFVFDMSVPDGLNYIKKGGFNVFTRQSEYEKEPSFYDNAQGVWMDMFLTDWIKEKDILFHLRNKKKVGIVSPDLHKRDYKEFWETLSVMPIIESNDVMICTDFPEEAKIFFYDKN